MKSCKIQINAGVNPDEQKTPFYQTSKIKLYTGLFSPLLLVLTIFLSSQKTQAQHLLPGYLLAQSPNQNVELYHYNSLIKKWIRVGKTGRDNIKSLAVDAKNELIYAVDKGTLGTINPTTAQFTAIGNIGSGNGENGTKIFNNIHGLAYNSNQEILYASNRNTNGIDELIKINPLNGKIIKNSMINVAGVLADYKIIEIKTFYLGSLFDSDDFLDLSYDNENDVLFIMHNYYRNYDGINGYKDIDSQNPFEDFRVSPIKDLTGIDVNDEGKIYGVFSDNKVSGGDVIDRIGGGVVNFFRTIETIDPNKGIETTFFGLDFYKTNSCKNHIVINGPLLSNYPKVAKLTINSNSTINFGVQYKSGKSISLNNNFEARGNVDFYAIIGDFCD